MKLTGEQARDLAYGDFDPDTDELTVVRNELVSIERWVSIHELVVQDKEGRYWRVFYDNGLTEHQDIGSFDLDDEVEFAEVERVETVTYEYRVKNAG